MCGIKKGLDLEASSLKYHGEGRLWGCLFEKEAGGLKKNKYKTRSS